MKKDDWYVNRILWRAKQHELFDKRCCKFDDLSEEKKSIIQEKISEECFPVIIFWKEKSTWTVLGSRAVYSYFDGKLRITKLDEIDKKVNVFETEIPSVEDAGKKSNFIFLEKSGNTIWAPEGAELFALMNILLMFPLNNIPN